jgi:enoyl-CoA hydratase/carnithine racemase
MTNTDAIRLTIADGVAVIRLNRPEVLNALNPAALTELVDTLQSVGPHPDVRSVIITGGPNAFCTGEDLREATQLTREQFSAQIDQFQRVADTLRTIPQPVIAAVAGPAVGGGLEIAVDCDLRIAADNATFNCPELQWGLSVTNGASVLLRNLVGDGWARELLMFGATLDAVEAHRIGLVTRVVPLAELDERAMELARKAAQHDRRAAALTKQLLNADPRDWTEVLAAETSAVVEGFDTDSVRARLASFAERRSATTFAQ